MNAALPRPKPATGWAVFRRNPGAMVSLVYLGLLVLVALFARPLLPDSSADANQQLPSLARMAPGSRAWVLTPIETSRWERALFTQWFQGPPPPTGWVPLADTNTLHTWEDTLHYTTSDGRVLTTLLPLIVCQIDPDHPLTLHFQHRYAKPYRYERDSIWWVAPGGEHHAEYLPELIKTLHTAHLTQLTFPLGTDTAGRDLLSRLVQGARISLAVGALAVLLSLSLGVSVGAVAGYRGGWVDSLAQWVMTVLWSLPSLLLAIALAFALGRGFGTLCLAIGLSVWVDIARVVRGEVLSLKHRTYIEAARVLGLPTWRIVLRHLLPGLAGPIAILAAANFATAVLLEAGLSFLGLGVAPPTPSWGATLQAHYRYVLVEGNAWLALVPGLAIVSLILALNTISQGLRDALDPRGTPATH